MNKTIRFSTEWIDHLRNGDKRVTVRDENKGFGVFAVANENGVLTGDYINVYKMEYLEYWTELEGRTINKKEDWIFLGFSEGDVDLDIAYKLTIDIKTLYGDRTDLYIHYFFLCNEDGSRK